MLLHLSPPKLSNGGRGTLPPFPDEEMTPSSENSIWNFQNLYQHPYPYPQTLHLYHLDLFPCC